MIRVSVHSGIITPLRNSNFSRSGDTTIRLLLSKLKQRNKRGLSNLYSFIFSFQFSEEDSRGQIEKNWIRRWGRGLEEWWSVERRAAEGTKEQNKREHVLRAEECTLVYRSIDRVLQVLVRLFR